MSEWEREKKRVWNIWWWTLEKLMLHKAQSMPDVLDGLFNTYFIIFFVYGVLMINRKYFLIHTHRKIHCCKFFIESLLRKNLLKGNLWLKSGKRKTYFKINIVPLLFDYILINILCTLVGILISSTRPL